jgi:PAS domain S-box-containing protein
VALRTGVQVRNFVAGYHNPVRQEMVWLEITATPLCGDSQDPPFQVVVTLHDITDRRRMEESLCKREATCRALLDTTGTGYVILDEAGTVLDANDEYVRLTGHESLQQILGRAVTEWTADCDRGRNAAEVRNCLAQGFVRNLEINYRDRNGKSVPLEIHAGTITTPDGLRIITLCRGIADRLEFDRALRESEERYRAVVNTQHEFVERFLPGGIMTFVNDALCRFTGMPREELLGQSFYPFIHEDERETVIRSIESLSREHPVSTNEGRIILANGVIHWMQWTNHAIFDREGNVVEYQSVGRDITEQKYAEEALQRERNLLFDIMNATDVMLAYLDADFNFLAVNNAYAQTCRMAPADMVGRNHFELYPDGENEAIFQWVRDTAIPVFYKDKHFRLPGQPERWTTYWDWSLTPVHDDSRVTGLVFSLRETTRYKKAELALRESGERYRRLHETMMDGFARVDMDGIIRESNDAFREMLGYSSEELPHLGYRDITPGKWHAFEERILREEVLPLGFSPVYEKEYVHKSGTIFPVELRTYLIRDHLGAPAGMWAIVRDISARKRYEEAVHRSERIAATIINASTEPIMFIDRDGIIITVNEAMAQRFGQSIEQTIGTPVFGYMTDEVRTVRQAKLDKALAGCKPVRFVDTRNERILDNCVYPVVDADGSVSGAAVFCRDITEQQRMEQALMESEKRYRRFIDTTNEGIGITDRDYRITYVNESLANMLGYEPEELIGFPVSRLLAIDEREEFLTLMAQRRQGLRNHRECRHQRKDGATVWLLTSSTPILDHSGDFQGCFAMFTDLTGRKEAEEALQQLNEKLEARVAKRTAALAEATETLKELSIELVQAEERERTRIAGELHDQVGQTLLLAKMKLDMLAHRSTRSYGRQVAAEIAVLIEKTIQDIRSLTFRMRPPVLDTAGIETALEWLCSAIEADYALRIEFRYDRAPKPLTDEARYSLYMAVRELLLNVVKHAGVSSACLALETIAEQLVVRVSDTGSGFEPRDAQEGGTICKGFGLFNVRHRIVRMGGDCVIESATGRGTVATLTVPLSAP